MKLEGIRVVDLSVFLPGPYLTLALADHGAEVIKIEPPGEGDPGRDIGLSDGPSTVFFRNLNRGKKSVVLDLKQPGERDALLTLCDTADVFVESFRPGTVDRLGVDYDTVRGRNPRIVYCSISAFGQQGPFRARPAHDLALEAESGLLSITLGEDGKPALPGMPIADVLAGMQGLAGVLMALLRRQQTGVGDYIDISMHNVTIGGMLNVMGPPMAEKRQPVVKHERTTGGAAFYHPYRTSDGRYLVLAGQEAKFIRNLLQAFGRPELTELCLRGPGPHQQPVTDFLAQEFSKRTLAEWDAYLRSLDVCYGRVNTLPEALEHEGLRAGGALLQDELGRTHIGPPIRFLAEPALPVLREPAHGEHTAQVLDGLAAARGHAVDE
jgi:crotonobetainyl-CoA:carnitine CoA-transferase CaiB-like acyl-CoA transferase